MDLVRAPGTGSGLTIGSSVISGGTTTRLLFDNAGVVDETNGLTWDATNKALTLAGGTLAGASVPALAITQTWNNAATAFTAVDVNVTNTNSSSASLLINARLGGATLFSVNRLGVLNSSSITSAGQISATTFMSVGSGNVYNFAARSQIASPADGTIRLQNAANAGFTSLQLGLATSAFPMFKVSGATVQVRLGDDSGFATIDMGIPKFSGANSTGAGAALLGSNSPAATLTAPYTWATCITSDGSTGYVPIWK